MRRLAAVLGFLLAVVFAPSAAWAVVDIRVDLTTQTMTVRSDSGVYIWPVSSARRGYVTPRGTYKPYRLARMHYSRKYDMAPMPHSIFFRGGYAIHGTTDARNLGRPASHGCIRLSKANAAALYAMVKKEGATIAIGGTPRHTMVASAKVKAKVKMARKKAGVAVARARQPAPSAALGYAPAQPSLIPDWPLR
jgi:hypothetical protein